MNTLVEICADGVVRQHGGASILVGDCRERLRDLPERSIHMVVTSPPYFGLRSYAGGAAEVGAEPTPAEFVAAIVETFRAVRRVLRDDGVAWLNLGDSYAANAGTGHDGRHDAGDVWGGTSIDKRGMGIPAGNLIGIPWLVAFALQADGWYLRSDVIWHKCLSGGAVVYARTQKGEMPMTLKDLVRLRPETVQLWDGEKWNQVVSFTKRVPDKQERKQRQTVRRNARQQGAAVPMSGELEIELRSGERIGCTADHRWPVLTSLGREVRRADALKVGDALPVVRLPEPPAPKRPAALDDELVGWFVGMYIAEGNKDGDDGIKLAGHVDEIPTRTPRLQEMADRYHATLNVSVLKGKSASWAMNSAILRGILSAYVSGHDAHDKHLNPRAWSRSDAFLRAVLMGYLEGDGHHDKKNERWRVGFCNNDALAADLRTLCARVGASLRLKRATTTGFEKKWPAWRGEVRFERNAAHCNSKQDGEIIAIRHSRARAYWDVALESEPHLFALASGVLTHNSAPMPESVGSVRWERCRTKQTTPTKQTTNQGAVDAGLVGGLEVAEWSPCPGCPKCAPNDGLVLRRGSWRPTKAHEYVFLLAKSADYYCDGDAVRETKLHRDLAAKATAERHDGRSNAYQTGSGRNDGNPCVPGAGFPSDASIDRNARSVWTLGPQPGAFDFCEACSAYYEGTHRPAKHSGVKRCKCGATDRWLDHFAIMPLALAERCVRTSPEKVCGDCGAPWARVVERWNDDRTRLVGASVDSVAGRAGRAGRAESGHRPTCAHAAAPVPATILDPFNGAGTTGLAAVSLGRRYVGCELRDGYARMAIERIKRVGREQLGMFDVAALNITGGAA